MTRPGRVIAVVLVMAVVVLSGCQRPPTSTSASTAAPDAAGSSAAPATPVAPDEQDWAVGGEPAPVSPDAQRTAERFVRAWARPGLSPAAWLAGVRPYAAPGYAALLDTVDPANVPADAVLGQARVVQSTTQRVDFDVPTNAGTIRVTCVHQGTRWLVLSVQGPQPS